MQFIRSRKKKIETSTVNKQKISNFQVKTNQEDTRKTTAYYLSGELKKV